MKLLAGHTHLDRYVEEWLLLHSYKCKCERRWLAGIQAMLSHSLCPAKAEDVDRTLSDLYPCIIQKLTKLTEHKLTPN